MVQDIKCGDVLIEALKAPKMCENKLPRLLEKSKEFFLRSGLRCTSSHYINKKNQSKVSLEWLLPGLNVCVLTESALFQSALPQSGKSVIPVPSLQSPTQQFPRYLNLKASHTLPGSSIPHAHVTVLIPGLISCH